LTGDGIEFTFKHAQVHGYSRFHLTVGPDWAGGTREHHQLEVLDPLHQVFAVVNRWFREINPKYYTLGAYWSDSFVCRERVLVDKGAVEANFMAFRDRCRHLPDLWVPKRTWYGRRIRRSG
jgi:hypothetical protein